jgi:endonuclease/exonuclease/phosphatase family metal-dependent hydrolase
MTRLYAAVGVMMLIMVVVLKREYEVEHVNGWRGEVGGHVDNITWYRLNLTHCGLQLRLHLQPQLQLHPHRSSKSALTENTNSDSLLFKATRVMTRRKPLPPVSACANHDQAPSKAPSRAGVQFRVLTHNIRYATNVPFCGEERWPVRCPRLCAELLFNSNSPETFICLQEVLHSQLQDIMHSLNGPANLEEWAYVGVGRDDGKLAGEYSPILYRSDVWKLRGWDTIWLSPTPEVPSKGWDAASVRIATIAHFDHVQTGRTVVIATTHLDDQGAVSRKQSAELLREIFRYETFFSGASAAILAGDFNSPPGDEAYKIMTAPGSFIADVADLNPQERHYGNEMTFTGFSTDSAPSRIDFIFLRKVEEVELRSYAVLANRFDDEVYLSDHRACVADFRLLPDL